MSTDTFTALLDKLATSYTTGAVGTPFSTTEAALAGSFHEDALNDRDVMDDADGQ